MSQARADAAPHFASQDERDRWQVQQYGHVRNGFRDDFERVDERPLLYFTRPFWEPGEDVIWERAAKACPVREYGAMQVWEYLAEVAKLAIGMDKHKGVPVGAMPVGAPSGRRAMLRAQAAEITAGTAEEA